MKSRVRGMLAMLVAIGVVAGCGSDQPTPTPTVVRVATPTPVATPVPVSLDRLVWTSAVDNDSGEPVDMLGSLPNDADRIIAAVHAPVLPAGTQLQARWSIDGESLPALDPDPVVTGQARTDAWVTWTLTWHADHPWPTGVLGITVEVNGAQQLAGELHIVWPRD